MSIDTRLSELLLRWEELRRQGQSPAAEELCRDCPELLGEFQRKIKDLESLEPFIHSTKGAEEPPPTISNAEAVFFSDDRTDFTAGSQPVPGYRLIERLGRGGFGEVWKAEAPGGFPVALKLVLLGESKGKIELRALNILKSLRHPNLLLTFGAWEMPGFLAVAMELADRTLWDRYRQAHAAGLSGIPRDELLHYFREAAQGIDYLNEPRHAFDGKTGMSIQHRDIKPQNILLVGKTVKLADFGLARLLEHTVTSHTGSLTPLYAAPEFFNGQTSNHSDQYGFAVAYCLLRGGRTPFTGNAAQVMAGHVNRPPDLTMVPEGERPVLARALSKNPQKRWPSCQLFVEALSGASIPDTIPFLLPPPSSASPRRWAFIAALAAVMLAVGGYVVTSAWKPWSRPAHTTKVLPVGELRRFEGHTGGVRTVAFSPDGQRILSGSDDGTLRLWDAEMGGEIMSYLGHTDGVTSVAFSPQGDRLLSGSKDNTLRLWKAEPKEELFVLGGHTDAITSVAFSPDGSRALSSSDDGTVRIWDLAKGTEVPRIKNVTAAVWSAAFCSGGRLVLYGGGDKKIRSWNLETSEEKICFSKHQDPVLCVVPCAGDELAASAGGDSNGNHDYAIRLWEIASGTEKVVFSGHKGAVGGLACSPDGRRLLSGSVDHSVRLWDMKTGDGISVFKEHTDSVYSVAFSPDGRRAISASKDKTIRLWVLPD